MSNQNYDIMLQMLDTQHNMLLVGHEDPDCDSLASLLALYRMFRGEEKNWRMVLRDEVPQNLRFLPHLEEMVSPDTLRPADYDAVLLVDCGEPRRTGAWLAEMLPGKKLYCIDHHSSNAFQGDLSLVEPDAAASGEIIAALCEYAGLFPDDDTALCLYSAMAGDTGCFRYQNTTPRALRLASLLLPQVDLEMVRVRLFEDRSYANLKMMAACLENIRTDCGGQLAYSWLDRATMLRYGATMADCHNIVNYTLVLSGVRLGILFEEHAGHVKMSFRCRRGLRVDELARRLGGGGHVLAAGCKIEGELDTVMPRVLAEARTLFQVEEN